jgi:mono/diheme cytochrome c family protein
MRVLAAIAGLLCLAAASGAIVLYSGLYNVAATEPHFAAVHWILETGMRRSVQRRAANIEVPSLDDPAMRRRGAVLVRRHCVSCHGAPGIAPSGFALGMTPLPGNLAHTAREWRPGEIYWVVRNGIKMAGMPAWEFRLSDDDLWAIVAHVEELPTLSPARYAALMRSLEKVPVKAASRDTQAPPDVARGKVAIQQYGCVTCHRIPGIVGAQAPVGPPLDRYADRALVAGMLPNTPGNLVRWLRSPRSLNPRTAMPDLGLSERDARDIAAYLQGLR